MPAPAESGYAFVVLLRDGDDATGLARLLEDVRLPDAETPSVFVAPPVRGIEFFADEASQSILDQWWADNVPGNALPVYLLNHEDELLGWVQGVDGTFYIGVPNPQVAEQYPASPQIVTFPSGGPLDFATVIMRDFSTAGGDAGDRGVIFDEGEALRMAALSSDFPIDLDDSSFDFGDAAAPAAAAPAPAPAPMPGFAPPGSLPGLPGADPIPFPPGMAPVDPGSTPFASPFGGPPVPAPGFGAGSAPAAPPRRKAIEPATPHPFDLIAGGASTPASAPLPPPGPAAPWPPAAAPPTTSPTPAPPRAPDTRPDAQSPAPAPQLPPSVGERIAAARSRFSLGGLAGIGKRGHGAAAETPNRELAQLMVDRGPTIVVMGSRKGGVGKTSYAAGIAIVAGTVLDVVGHRAAIVDANIANPDAWGQMNLREGAATVRDVVAALTANQEPPPPVHSTTPALAVYPESRETTEYSKTDIRRFAEYLRRRYTFIVVDMTNRLPDPMAGPEAAASAYWLEHADVLVLPTTSSKQDFNGVLDFLDVRGLPPTVVPYIVPAVRKNREHPVTKQYLSVIRERVHRIVDIPDEADKVRYAGMEGVPVEQVSPALRLAYRELTEVVVRVPKRARI